MPKREHSPGPLPLAKRAHTISPNVHVHRDHRGSSSFDSYFYDELILVIFSYLSWADLCVIQPTNRNWCRLSLDNQVLISNNMLPDNSDTDSELHLNSSGNLYTLANMERPDSGASEDSWDDPMEEKSSRYRAGHGPTTTLMILSVTGSGCFASVQTGEQVCQVLMFLPSVHSYTSR